MTRTLPMPNVVCLKTTPEGCHTGENNVVRERAVEKSEVKPPMRSQAKGCRRGRWCSPSRAHNSAEEPARGQAPVWETKVGEVFSAARALCVPSRGVPRGAMQRTGEDCVKVEGLVGVLCAWGVQKGSACRETQPPVR